MQQNIKVHPFCDICGRELSDLEKEKNGEFENFEFPFCNNCFDEAIKKIRYIVNK